MGFVLRQQGHSTSLHHGSIEKDSNTIFKATAVIVNRGMYLKRDFG